jgi:hypothetical protein
MLEDILKFERTEEGLFKIYDRFSFDELFRLLLINGFEHEEALSFILCNCALSALVFQERIYNSYYLNIHVEDVISSDLLQLERQCLIEIIANRYVNVKDSVGPVSLWIRECAPKTIDDWREYYFRNVRPKEHISAEIEDITEEDCIEYMVKMVIDRTFDGYMTEIKTIYGQLEKILGVKIHPAPDEWDRLYAVDFYIKIGDNHIGLQIKPAGGVSHIPQIFKEHKFQQVTHQKFTEKYGGKVFYVISIKEGGKKRIYNMEVIDEIKDEMIRLKGR